MAHIEGDDTSGVLTMARRQARQSGYIQRAQVMLAAAGIAAFLIVAVAAAMMTTLL